MLLARLKQLESSPDSQPAEARDNTIDYLARLTAIHQSLVYLDKIINAPPEYPNIGDDRGPFVFMIYWES
ncbi:hypothetical protein LLG95_15505 [bacterium]|nr:hypothetical protein [bacterium]